MRRLDGMENELSRNRTLFASSAGKRRRVSAPVGEVGSGLMFARDAGRSADHEREAAHIGPMVVVCVGRIAADASRALRALTSML